MEPTQQHHSEEPEFVFDPEEHQVVSLDEALEIFGDDGAVPEAAQESDDEDDDEERLWPDNAVAHLASHTGSLFSISVHPRDPLLAVSGGEDDLAYLWKIDTGEEIAKLSGHSDSVSAVAFSFDGELVASGGMDGKVRMWRRVKDVPGGTWQWARWEFLTSLDGPDEVTTLLWHPKGNVLLAGSADGTIWMWNLPSGKTMGIFAQHTAAITSLSWVSPSEAKRFLSTADDATAMLWSPAEPSAPLQKYHISPSDARFNFGMGPEDGGSGLTCAAVNGQGSLALVGGASAGALRIINLNTGGFLASLVEGHAADCAISAVLWMPIGPTPGLWITAGTDGKVCAWDVGHGTLRWTVQHPKTSEHPAPNAEGMEDHQPQPSSGEQSSGMDVDETSGALAVTAENAISCLYLHPDSTHLTSSASNGSVITWDAKTGVQVNVHEGHQMPVHALAVNCDGTAVVSGGDDGLGRVHLVAPQQQEQS